MQDGLRGPLNRFNLTRIQIRSRIFLRRLLREQIPVRSTRVSCEDDSVEDQDEFNSGLIRPVEAKAALPSSRM